MFTSTEKHKQLVKIAKDARKLLPDEIPYPDRKFLQLTIDRIREKKQISAIFYHVDGQFVMAHTMDDKNWLLVHEQQGVMLLENGNNLMTFSSWEMMYQQFGYNAEFNDNVFISMTEVMDKISG